MIEVLLCFSVVGNILFIWYIVQLLRRFLSFQEELDAFALKLAEYETHIEIVHNLERFYGDETLSNLLRHSKDVAQECKQFQNVILNQEEEYGEEEEQEH